MLTVPTPEGVTVRGTMCRVFDAEKGTWRTVNAATVSRLFALAARPSRPRATAPDRAPIPLPRTPRVPDPDFDSFGY